MASNPKNNIETEKQNLEIKKMAFLNALMGIIESKKNRFSILTTQLESASPLQLLNRGYAVVTTKDDKSIKSIRNISPGASVKTKLSDGSFMSKVERIDKD